MLYYVILNFFFGLNNCIGLFKLGLVFEANEKKTDYFLGHNVSNPDVLVVSRNGDLFEIFQVAENRFMKGDSAMALKAETAKNELIEKEKQLAPLKKEIVEESSIDSEDKEITGDQIIQDSIKDGMNYMRDKKLVFKLVKDYQSRIETLRSNYLSTETKRLYAGKDTDVALMVNVENRAYKLEKKLDQMSQIKKLGIDGKTKEEKAQDFVKDTTYPLVYAPIKVESPLQQFESVIVKDGFKMMNLKGDCLMRNDFSLVFGDCKMAVLLRLVVPNEAKLPPKERIAQRDQIRKSLEQIDKGLKELDQDVNNFREEKDRIVDMANTMEKKRKEEGKSEDLDEKYKANNNDLTKLRMKIDAKIASSNNKSLGLNARKNMIEKIAGADKQKDQ